MEKKCNHIRRRQIAAYQKEGNLYRVSVCTDCGQLRASVQIKNHIWFHIEFFIEDADVLEITSKGLIQNG